jgi:hypothetical protein
MTTARNRRLRRSQRCRLSHTKTLAEVRCADGRVVFFTEAPFPGLIVSNLSGAFQTVPTPEYFLVGPESRFLGHWEAYPALAPTLTDLCAVQWL